MHEGWKGGRADLEHISDALEGPCLDRGILGTVQRPVEECGNPRFHETGLCHVEPLRHHNDQLSMLRQDLETGKKD